MSRIEKALEKGWKPDFKKIWEEVVYGIAECKTDEYDVGDVNYHKLKPHGFLLHRR